MTARKRAKKVADPFERACRACGALVNQPCDTRGNNHLPLIPRASRLVHAARLEGTTDA